MFGEVLGIEDGEEICSTEPYATPVLDVRNQNHPESCEEAYKLQKDYQIVREYPYLYAVGSGSVQRALIMLLLKRKMRLVKQA